jgi:RNA polymerase sigma factor (sigma-70 family)
MSYEITQYDVDRTKILARKAVRKWEPGLVNYDDVLGDALEGLVKASHKYDESFGKHFWAYATATVNGYILNGFRRRFGEKREKLELARAQPLVISNDEDGSEFSPHDVAVEDTATGQDLLDKIRQLGLGATQTRILIMFAAGYKQRDIALKLGLSDGNICTTVQRIRKNLSKEQFVELMNA